MTDAEKLKEFEDRINDPAFKRELASVFNSFSIDARTNVADHELADICIENIKSSPIVLFRMSKGSEDNTTIES